MPPKFVGILFGFKFWGQLSAWSKGVLVLMVSPFV